MTAQNRPPQLFLDCDGVLANFDRCAERIFGVHPRKAEERMGGARFWKELREQDGFFRNLAPMNDARILFEAVAHLDPVILTGCPEGEWAEPQKRDWAATHFPGTQVITCRSAEKRAHMRPGDVLVDDVLKYRYLWEQAGGIFIHHTSADESIRKLRGIGLI